MKTQRRTTALDWLAIVIVACRSVFRNVGTKIFKPIFLLTGMIEPGDVYKIGNAEFKIVKVGSEVQKNLMNLGHITIKFDGGTGELLEGSIHVEDKAIPEIKPGDMIEIYKAAESAADDS